MGNSQYKEVNQIPDYDTSLTYPLTSKNLVTVHDCDTNSIKYWSGPVSRQEIHDLFSRGGSYYCDSPTLMYTPRTETWGFYLGRGSGDRSIDMMAAQLSNAIFSDKSHLTKTCMCGLSPVKYAKRPTVEEYYCINCGSSRYVLLCSKCEDTEEHYYVGSDSHKCKQQKK
jgi:hypothetical protein